MIAYATLGVMLRKLADVASPGTNTWPETLPASDPLNGGLPAAPNSLKNWRKNPASDFRFYNQPVATGTNAASMYRRTSGPTGYDLDVTQQNSRGGWMRGTAHGVSPDRLSSKPGTLDMTTPEMQGKMQSIARRGMFGRALGNSDPHGLTPTANKARWDAQRPAFTESDVSPGSGQAWSPNKTTQPAQVNGKAFGFGGTNAQNAAFQDRMAQLQKAGPNWRQVAAKWKSPVANPAV